MTKRVLAGAVVLVLGSSGVAFGGNAAAISPANPYFGLSKECAQQVTPCGTNRLAGVPANKTNSGRASTSIFAQNGAD
jgi:hypothetical protein